MNLVFKRPLWLQCWGSSDFFKVPSQLQTSDSFPVIPGTHKPVPRARKMHPTHSRGREDEWFLPRAEVGNLYHLVPQEMEGVAQWGRGGNPSLENIPKPPVLFLPPLWKFLPMIQSSGMPPRHQPYTHPVFRLQRHSCTLHSSQDLAQIYPTGNGR